MNNILLIDGNSMLFRAYYGTLGRGHMRTSDGVTTNAVYGFSTMLNKALEMMKPTHVLIAFDTAAKTFRHDLFDAYKGTRKDVDEELVSQFALVREFIDAYPIKRYELEGYEADDIIGTLSKEFTDAKINILTSDRDMFQLVTPNVSVVLMKKGLTDLHVVTPTVLQEEFGYNANQVVDMKALMGDASDNIPGVPSVGEKTALKLINQYATFENVYKHKEEIKGKLGEKIREFENQARLSYQLAEINCAVPMSISLECIELNTPLETLNAFYRKYEMNSLIIEDRDTAEIKSSHITLDSFESMLELEAVFIHTVYIKESLSHLYVGSEERVAYLSLEDNNSKAQLESLFNSRVNIVVDSAKGLYRYALENGIKVNRQLDDLLVYAFINDSSITTMDRLKDEFSLWFNEYEPEDARIHFTLSGLKTFRALKESAQSKNVASVYESIEKPLVPILAECEFQGINVNRSLLDEIAATTLNKLNTISEKVFGFVGHEFNLNSPKQLAEVLFDELELPTKKKRSTAVDVLESLIEEHPIIELILEHRKYQKLYSTYAVGLTKHIHEDGKIHTTFNQHATQTGRLSSSDPNLQNISAKDEESRMIRKAFVASDASSLVSIDYSQIELRVLSYLADEQNMIEAFNGNHDIHEETAKRIFETESVDRYQRRQAKSVNFGIIYGMSEFGLAKQLGISMKEAKVFIQRYHDIYPNITKYMDEVVDDCEVNGYVTTLFNRRRYIPEINDRNRAVKEFGKRAAMNAPIQGTAADLIKLAMIQCDAYLKENKLKTKMILQVHDELVFDVSDDELSFVPDAIVEIMEHIVDWPIKLKVSVEVGKDWF